MLVTEIYNGQGLGNQLWCYVTVRVIAKDKGYDFGIQSPEKFKGHEFMPLDFGQPVIGGTGPEGGPPLTLPKGIQHYYSEKKITHPLNGVDIRMHDKDLVNISDKTKIDGIMQDEQYILHRKNEIQEWLRVNTKYECYDYADDNVCVINFRGGEYVRIKSVFLPQKYWDDAVRHMRAINKNFRFIVITDDVSCAKKFFPHFKVLHFSIGKDYVIIKNAKYLILSNSSFAWFPAWLNKDLRFCIAPKYWSQYNTSNGFWGCSYNITKDWLYLDRHGKLNDYDTCLKELHLYITENPDFFIVNPSKRKKMTIRLRHRTKKMLEAFQRVKTHATIIPASEPSIKIEQNFLVVSNYNNDLRWVPEYTHNYLIYNQSESYILPEIINSQQVVKNKHTGHNISDHMTFIIDHYNNLPECIIFAKGNVFPRHITQKTFNAIANNRTFTPIEDPETNQTRKPVSYYEKGGFHEINNDWYVKIVTARIQPRYARSYNEYLSYIFKNPIFPRYIRFAPGANYIIPKDLILRHPKIFYENLKTMVSYGMLTLEAYFTERALYTIWTSDYKLNDNMLK